MLIISKSDVKKVLNMETAIQYMEQVFADHYNNKTITPLRINIPVEAHHGNLLFMPSYLPNMESAGVKIVSVYPENRKSGLETIHSILIYNDIKTGEPLALMDAEYLTAIRTGAVSGVAAKFLSLKTSTTLSLFGIGTQGKKQLEAICSVRPIKKVYIFNRDPLKAEAFAKDIQQTTDLEIIVGGDLEQAIRSSQIILTATTSKSPLFKSEWVSPGTFISAVGGYTKDMQEIPEELVSSISVVVDAFEAALKEAGDLLIPVEKGLTTLDHYQTELGQVVTGHFSRKNPDEILFFKSVGLAMQDLCLAPLIYNRTIQNGLGIKVEL